MAAQLSKLSVPSNLKWCSLHTSLSFGAPAHKMSKAEKVQSAPDGSSYHFHSSQTSKRLKFWLSGTKVSLGMKLEYWWLKSWGVSAASQRGDGYKPPDKRGSRAVFWLWVGQMRPSSVRAAHPNPSPSVVTCQAATTALVVVCFGDSSCQGPSVCWDTAAGTGRVSSWAQTRHPGTGQCICQSSATTGRAWDSPAG